ncbi:SAM-dependent methyltransferase [Actinomadura logoneensis]|uniref:SAM-dependent methyltransferase n=1 Tax=Actinomadura logoneensis TaxID=2293572 RepID=A0A372JU55_9ACTN|nr:class I SAM-dependent methyltransferase family protein [Actinomadura logoneensis]RFU43555.1 SAM-dependent methyltransferase [Actinomadura logoneensis]
MEQCNEPDRRDWAAWHDAYDEPGSALSRRLRTVQQRLREAVDAAPPGRIRVVSLCAGQGRDLIGALRDHPRRDDLAGRLVELDPANVRRAGAAAREAGMKRVSAVVGDASRTDAYAGAVPADVVLVCGVFGNIADADVERTIGLLPQLCAPGAFVVWTRNRQPPDLTPRIREWFARHDFEERWISPPEERAYGVGVHRFNGRPQPLRRGVRMFTFIGYDILRNGDPWPT